MGEVRDVGAVRTHDVDEGRVVDGVASRRLGIVYPLGVDAIGLGDGIDLGLGAGQSDEPRMEALDVACKLRRRVARRIERDQDRCDGLSLGAELVERAAITAGQSHVGAQ
jgi:hypothetical protein